jgi:hypothetical protein
VAECDDEMMRWGAPWPLEVCQGPLSSGLWPVEPVRLAHTTTSLAASLVDQTPGCSLRYTMQQSVSVSPLQASFAECDRNSDPSRANGKPPVFGLGRSSSTSPNVSLLQSCCVGQALRYH